MTVLRSVSSFGYTQWGTVSHVKYICVDIPCSQETFIEHFADNIEGLDYVYETNAKFTVAPSNLNAVFCVDWNSFQYKNTHTRHRVMGMIILHYMCRKKIFIQCAGGNVCR